MFRLFRDIYRHLGRSRRRQLLFVLVLMLFGALAEAFTLGAVVPFLGLLISPEMADRHVGLASTLDVVAGMIGGNRLQAASVLFASLAAAAAVLRLTLSWASFKVVFSVGADLGAAVFSRTLQQPYSYHLARNSSQTLGAVEKVGLLTAGVLAPVMQLMIAGVMVLAIFGAMLWVNPYVALAAGGLFGALYVGISLWAKKRLIANSQAISGNSTLRIQYLQEGLGGIRDVLLERNQSVYVDQFSKVDRAVRNAQAANATLAGAPKYFVESVAIVMIVLLANGLVNLAGGVAQALPVLGTLALGAQRLLPYVQNIYNGYASFKGSFAASQETIELLNLPIDAPVPYVEQDGKKTFGELTSVELRGIEFAYAPGSKPILSGVNLILAPGDRIGFVGSTGSGKSTLIDIIMGLLSPTDGTILVNGRPLDGEGLYAWQRRIAHVPQSIFLCDKSIAENIALGLPRNRIDESRLQWAVRLAQLTDFVQQLPEGVDTGVGERGVQLSGGQRQRIGIARALYRQVDVLVLDEATSALDSETETLVMDAIYELNPNLIVLMIAHRVSTLQKCSAVYRLLGGRLQQATAEIVRNRQTGFSEQQPVLG